MALWWMKAVRHYTFDGTSLTSFAPADEEEV